MEVGDHVELNQPIVEIETAKAVVAVPCPFAGTIQARMGEVGDTLAVGSVLVRVLTSSAGPSHLPTTPHDAPSGNDPQAPPGTHDDGSRPLVGYGIRPDDRDDAAESETNGNGSRPRAKPPVRRLARDLGIDLVSVRGSGPGGIITREDVTAYGAAHATSRAFGFRGRRPGEVEVVRGVRRRIMDKMETSRREIPAASCTREVDLTRLWDLRADLTRQARGDGLDVRITPFTVIMRATVIALRRFPTLNARLVGRDPDAGAAGEVHLLEDINLGVAVDTDRGLMVPNIRRAQDLSLVELAARGARLAGQARDGTIDPADVTGGTFTVNNYGAFGNDDGDPILNHPEAGILGVGAIR
ncbi:MAG: dihydrolipoamide acetyltransferase family protein, partial [Nitriliruptoraceae bacterium]